MDTNSINIFKNFIVDRCGLEFNSEREETLVSAINQRMMNHNCDHDHEYLNLLGSSEEEFYRLVGLLTVNETYFYREPAHIKILMDLISGSSWRIDSDNKLRVLCAGCSTGEEPYSLAIAIHNSLGERFLDKIQIIGVDIDSKALEIARKGIYSGMSFRSLEPEIKEKYFSCSEKGRYIVSSALRNAVSFDRCNLTISPLSISARPFHVIFYRNVSIYFPQSVQRKVFSNLSDSLVDDGVIFVGSAETLYHNFGMLTLTEKYGHFYFRKGLIAEVKDRRISLNLTEPKIQKRDVAVIKSQKLPYYKKGDADQDFFRKARPSFDEALKATQGKKLDKALEIVKQLLVEDPGFIKGQALKACILMNMQRLDEAKETCLLIIEQNPLVLEATLLLAIIANTQFEFQDAVKFFRQSLYIAPDCWLAHFYLAEIYRSENKVLAARKAYQRVAEILQEGKIEQHGLSYFPLAFNAEHFIKLCHHNISRMSLSAGTSTG